jgi:hypothetical protein
LIVIVIADEIANGIFRQQLAKLIVELSRQGLVRSDHEGGFIDLGDDIRHGKCFARAGNTEKHLAAPIILEIFDELSDRARLVALRFEIRNELELSFVSSADHSIKDSNAVTLEQACCYLPLLCCPA